ncbi:MAG: type II toxin-antitoxin system HicB family antitoxin [Cyanobacteria bacterium J06621_8]
MNLKYQMTIQWSEEDNLYLVALPDFPGQQWSTHGNTYEEAAANGREVLELLIESYQERNLPLPKPTIISLEAA